MAWPSETPEDFNPCLAPVPFYLDIPVEKPFRGPFSRLYAAFFLFATRGHQCPTDADFDKLLVGLQPGFCPGQSAPQNHRHYPVCQCRMITQRQSWSTVLAPSVSVFGTLLAGLDSVSWDKVY